MMSKIITVDHEMSLLEAVHIYAPGTVENAPCGGKGRCGKCRVYAKGDLSPMSEHERLMLGDDADKGVRLSCMCRIYGSAEVSRYGGEGAVIEIKGKMPEYSLSPMCGGNILAVDIGTTTVALYILDSSAGNPVFVDSFENPQREYGADVISRIGAVIDDYGNLDRQGELIAVAINDSIAKSGVAAESINAAVIAGNTTMLHLLAHLDPRGIANAPFTPSSLFGNKYKAKKIGLDLADDAEAVLLPCFSAYVGGDICAGIAACEADRKEKNILFIDIGTNGEMALCHADGSITVCATAAGPAFEGAHIECGMGGFEGALSHIRVENGDIVCKVIGGGEATGICGSGLIDGVAALLELGVIDETGYPDEDMCSERNSLFGHDEDDRYYFTKNVYLSAKDIREVQLAKSAIRSGIISLEAHTSTEEEDIDSMLIAGGFGAHIDLNSAAKIGMLPPGLLDKAASVGNTAGSGAVLYALSAEHRENMDKMGGKVKYIELSDSAVFRDAFIEQMMFEEE